MVDKSGKTNAKRLPKGQRTHARRLKQAARKEVTQVNPHSSPAQPPRVHKKQDNPEEKTGWILNNQTKTGFEKKLSAKQAALSAGEGATAALVIQEYLKNVG